MNERTLLIENGSKRLIDKRIINRSRVTDKVQKYSYQDFRMDINLVCHVLFKTVYICFGFLQSFAIFSGFLKVFHSDNIIIILSSLIFGFLPVFGPFLAIGSANIAWDWSFGHGFLMFVTPYLIVNSPLVMIILFDIYKDIKRWQAEGKIWANNLLETSKKLL